MLFLRFTACCVKVTTHPSLSPQWEHGLPHCPQGTGCAATPAAEGPVSRGMALLFKHVLLTDTRAF